MNLVMKKASPEASFSERRRGGVGVASARLDWFLPSLRN